MTLSVPVILTGAVALIFFTGAIALVLKIRKEQETCRANAPATLVGYEKKEVTEYDTETNTSHIRVTYFPIYEYTVNGETRRAQTGNGTGKMPIAIGSSVTLYYDAGDTDKFYVVEEHEGQKKTAIVIFFVGLICAGLMIYLGVFR